MGAKARTPIEASNRRLANLTMLDLDRLGFTVNLVPARNEKEAGWPLIREGEKS